MWEMQRKGVCSEGEQRVEAQQPCSGAGMPKGDQPHLDQGLQTTMQGQLELCTGLVLLLRLGCSRESAAPCSRCWLCSCGAALLRLCVGLGWEYQGKDWS